MASYTYDLSGFVTVDSEFELSLVDAPSRRSGTGGDVVVRRGEADAPAVEWTGRRVVVTVPPSMPVEKDAAAEPERFTKILLSAVQTMLLRREATLAFGSAFRAPDGTGVGLFGPSGCGKSAASFRLAREWDCRLLADDLLVVHEGVVYPFPRYLNLPRDVAAVERWLRSEGASTERVRLWPGAADVPRRSVTESVPERIELDAVLVATPRESPARSPDPIPTEDAAAALIDLVDESLAGWITESRTREAVDDRGVDRRPILRSAVTDAACYRLETPRSDLARSVAEFVGR
jgi:hypothetical protein